MIRRKYTTTQNKITSFLVGILVLSQIATATKMADQEALKDAARISEADDCAQNLYGLPLQTKAGHGSFPLVSKTGVATIWHDANDHRVVGIVSDLLAEDVKKVTGLQPESVIGTSLKADNAVLIGTLGKSSLIDHLAESGKIDIKEIRGRWESYLVAIVDPGLVFDSLRVF
jgi:hypothetical protein